MKSVVGVLAAAANRHISRFVPVTKTPMSICV